MWRVSPACFLLFLLHDMSCFSPTAIEPPQCDKVPCVFYWGQWAEHCAGASGCRGPLTYDQGKELSTTAHPLANTLAQTAGSAVDLIMWSWNTSSNTQDTGTFRLNCLGLSDIPKIQCLVIPRGNSGISNTWPNNQSNTISHIWCQKECCHESNKLLMWPLITEGSLWFVVGGCYGILTWTLSQSESPIPYWNQKPTNIKPFATPFGPSSLCRLWKGSCKESNND